jgi:MYXO-CTERM domain-containing protein
VSGSEGICSPLAAATACRAAVGDCDVAEQCDGIAVTCPDDGFVADGTACDGGSGVCVAGACEPPGGGGSTGVGESAGAGGSAGTGAPAGEEDGCSCRMTGSPRGSGVGGWLALLGFGLLVGRRRRRDGLRSVLPFAIALALATVGCSSEEGFFYSFGKGELTITSTLTVADQDGQPPGHGFRGYIMTIERNAPGISPKQELTEISIHGDGPFSGVLPLGSLLVKLHAEPAIGQPLELTSFPGAPSVGEAKVLYSTDEGDTVTATGMLAVARHDFTPPEDDDDFATLSVEIAFGDVEVGGNGVPPYTIDGILELSGRDTNPSEEDSAEEGGSGGDGFLLTCNDARPGFEQCVHYTFELESKRDDFFDQCEGLTSRTKDAHNCPPGATGNGFCRHTAPGVVTDTYTYNSTAAELMNRCETTQGQWMN